MVGEQVKAGGRAQLFRSIFDQNVIGIVLADLDGTILESNDAFHRMTGYTEQELRHLTVTQLTHPDDRPGTAEFFGVSPSSGHGDASFVSEKRYLRKDGGVVWSRIHATMIRDARRAPIFGFAVVEDITERKAAEQRLASEKERLAVTLRSIGDAVISTDAEGKIVLFNGIAEHLTDWKQDEAQGRPLAEVLSVFDRRTRQSSEHVIAEALRAKGRFETAAPLLLRSRSGIERFIAGTGGPILDPSSTPVGMVFAFRDVTERIRMEEAHARTEKLESLGYLAGGIAHDFNNHLTAILGNISLARSTGGANGEGAELLREAEQAALQARHLTQQLLTFAKGGDPIKQVISPGPLIREAVEFSLRGSACSLDIRLMDNLWSIEADPNQIGQVVRHLVINADQAMPDGGRLVVSAENTHLDTGEFAPLARGRYVRLRVSDSGVGIPDHHLDRIFDPYFTTRPKGSGLGLAASLSVIKNHGGHIAVESQLGKGTTFHVLIPAVLSGSSESPPAAAIAPGGADHPRVLVMDDEDAIRKLTARILARSGFQVATAADGTEALELFESARAMGEPFDVVILDLTVRGGMGGKDTMLKLRELDPAVRVIVSSGYSNDPIMANHRQFGFRGIVAKPYQTEKLVAVVRTVLAAT